MGAIASNPPSTHDQPVDITKCVSSHLTGILNKELAFLQECTYFRQMFSTQ